MKMNRLTALALGLVVIATPVNANVNAQPDSPKPEAEAVFEMDSPSMETMIPTVDTESLVNQLMAGQKTQTTKTTQTTTNAEDKDDNLVDQKIQEAKEAAEEREAQLAKAQAAREKAEKEAAKLASIRKGQLAKIAAVRAQKIKKAAEKSADATGSFYNGVRLMYSEPYEGIENHLTRSNGVVHYNGNRETWYSIHEPGQTVTAVTIPGKHIAKDGTIRDKDGFICVAASQRYKRLYTTLMTSVGPAKVYDTGCSYGTIDIYTNW